ncbi:unnamed protein product [Fusarium graminearum]|nr:unnamed protein product [Fusarium graminearum]CAG1995365.1 unnamed protein product [Fusarium graminearum]
MRPSIQQSSQNPDNYSEDDASEPEREAGQEAQEGDGHHEDDALTSSPQRPPSLELALPRQ